MSQDPKALNYLDLCMADLLTTSAVRKAILPLLDRCGGAVLRCGLSPLDEDGFVYRFYWGDIAPTESQAMGEGLSRKLAENILSAFNKQPPETRAVMVKDARGQLATQLTPQDEQWL